MQLNQTERMIEEKYSDVTEKNYSKTTRNMYEKRLTVVKYVNIAHTRM